MYYDNPTTFNNLLQNQKFLRRLDEIHLIDSSGNRLTSSTLNPNSEYIPPEDKALKRVFISFFISFNKIFIPCR